MSTDIKNNYINGRGIIHQGRIFPRLEIIGRVVEVGDNLTSFSWNDITMSDPLNCPFILRIVDDPMRSNDDYNLAIEKNRWLRIFGIPRLDKYKGIIVESNLVDYYICNVTTREDVIDFVMKAMSKNQFDDDFPTLSYLPNLNREEPQEVATATSCKDRDCDTQHICDDTMVTESRDCGGCGNDESVIIGRNVKWASNTWPV